MATQSTTLRRWPAPESCASMETLREVAPASRRPAPRQRNCPPAPLVAEREFDGSAPEDDAVRWYDSPARLRRHARAGGPPVRAHRESSRARGGSLGHAGVRAASTPCTAVASRAERLIDTAVRRGPQALCYLPQAFRTGGERYGRTDCTLGRLWMLRGRAFMLCAAQARSEEAGAQGVSGLFVQGSERATCAQRVATRKRRVRAPQASRRRGRGPACLSVVASTSAVAAPTTVCEAARGIRRRGGIRSARTARRRFARKQVPPQSAPKPTPACSSVRFRA